MLARNGDSSFKRSLAPRSFNDRHHFNAFGPCPEYDQHVFNHTAKPCLAMGDIFGCLIALKARRLRMYLTMADYGFDFQYQFSPYD
jgi:hypothetical protein